MEELKKKLEKIEKEKNELKEAVNLMGTSKVAKVLLFVLCCFKNLSDNLFLLLLLFNIYNFVI